MGAISDQVMESIRRMEDEREEMKQKVADLGRKNEQRRAEKKVLEEEKKGPGPCTTCTLGFFADGE